MGENLKGRGNWEGRASVWGRHSGKWGRVGVLLVNGKPLGGRGELPNKRISQVGC